MEVRGPRELRLLTVTFNEMAARLAANEEQRRRFLADITHELRNPLAVLQSEIEAQMDGVHPRDDHHLASLLDETRRLGHLVDDLHTLALAETGRLVLRREAVALGALVDEVVGRHEAHARQRDVALRVSIDPGTAQGVGGPGPGPPGPRQPVGQRHPPHAGRRGGGGGGVDAARARLRRRPDGAVPGDGRRPRVPGGPTGPACSTGSRGRATPGGSGLGLSIVRDLVRAHGGTIDAGNDPVTGGASVSFTLPPHP